MCILGRWSASCGQKWDWAKLEAGDHCKTLLVPDNLSQEMLILTEIFSGPWEPSKKRMRNRTCFSFKNSVSSLIASLFHFLKLKWLLCMRWWQFARGGVVLGFELSLARETLHHLNHFPSPNSFPSLPHFLLTPPSIWTAKEIQSSEQECLGLLFFPWTFTWLLKIIVVVGTVLGGCKYKMTPLF